MIAVGMLAIAVGCCCRQRPPRLAVMVASVLVAGANTAAPAADGRPDQPTGAHRQGDRPGRMEFLSGGRRGHRWRAARAGCPPATATRDSACCCRRDGPRHRRVFRPCRQRSHRGEHVATPDGRDRCGSDGGHSLAGDTSAGPSLGHGRLPAVVVGPLPLAHRRRWEAGRFSSTAPPSPGDNAAAGGAHHLVAMGPPARCRRAGGPYRCP
jgi:hypothetical protein